MAESQSTRMCSVDGCEKPETVKKKRLCAMHYSRLRRHGATGPPEPLRGGSCTVGGCERGREAQGLCSAHYQRARKGQSLVAPVRLINQYSECTVDWCDNAPVGNGLCAMHYQRSRSGASMDQAPREYVRWGTDQCGVAGCEKPRRNKAYCSGHAARAERGADVHAPWAKVSDPDDPDTWARYVNSDGYVVLTSGVGGVKRQMLEHRWVMQKAIKRELLPDENVHHVNGVRDDNSLSNLEIWSSSQPSGQRAEDKLAWARELVARYEAEIF